MISLFFASLLLATQAPAPADAPAPPDVVVMAHRLHRLRPGYSSDGRAEVSSGDRRLDDIGCKVVGWCVRRGFEEPDRALACFHRFQARLDDRAQAGEDRRPGVTTPLICSSRFSW